MPFTRLSRNLILATLLAASLPLTAQRDPENTRDEDREIAYWVAPMDPNYRRDRPGKSPMGMELVPVYADQLLPAGRVDVPNGIQQLMNLRTAEVKSGRLWRRIDAPGEVQWDMAGLHHIHTRISGWVEEIAIVSVGDRVEAGQLLYTLFSPELVNAQDDLIRARKMGDNAVVDNARNRLRTLGVQPEVIERIEDEKTSLRAVPWYARRGGFVSRLGARHGMYVTADTEIAEIASPSPIWVIADVSGRQVDWLEAGQQAEISTDYRPGETFQSRIDYLYPQLDPATRTQRVRLALDNSDLQLKPGMWTRVRIFAGPVDDRTYIPREALIRTGRSERVVVQTSAEEFEIREVESGMESGEFVAIVSGLEPGETVVTSGQFLIDSEASQSAAGERLEGGRHGH